MIIDQGPLPPDGAVVDPATFLESWITGTTVVDMPGGVFKGGTLQFIFSQTEPPPLADRFVGMLWFKRGEGRLYIWDKPDLPSALTFTNEDWICLTDRRELWCQASADIALGMPVSFTYTLTTGYGGFLLTTETPLNADPCARPIWLVSTHSLAAGATDIIGPLIWVAMETAASGNLFRVCELGVCRALYKDGTSGVGVVDECHPGLFYQTDPSCGTYCPITPITEILTGMSEFSYFGRLEQSFLHQAPLLATNTTVT